MVKQYLFIDESGDIGSITRRGASRVFVMSAIHFPDKISTMLAVEKIQALKKHLKIPEGYEFKYQKTRGLYKEAFFGNMKNVECQAFALVVNKKPSDPNTSYGKYLGHLFTQVKRTLPTGSLAFHIVIDGKGSKRYLMEIKKAVKDKSPHDQLDIRYSNSKNDELIQIADMVSGLVYEYETERRIINNTAKSDGAKGSIYKNIRRFYRGLTRNAV